MLKEPLPNNRHSQCSLLLEDHFTTGSVRLMVEVRWEYAAGEGWLFRSHRSEDVPPEQLASCS